jgi:hypothetical protein
MPQYFFLVEQRHPRSARTMNTRGRIERLNPVAAGQTAFERQLHGPFNGDVNDAFFLRDPAIAFQVGFFLGAPNPHVSFRRFLKRRFVIVDYPWLRFGAFRLWLDNAVAALIQVAVEHIDDHSAADRED